MPVGQDQKPAIIGEQLEPIVAMAERPIRSNDPVRRTSRRPLKNSKRATHCSAQVATYHSGFADLGQGSQIVMLLHQLLKNGALPADRPDGQ